MSKLGKVYVLCINRKQKDVYPVVYTNKDYLYCKIYGDTRLRSFHQPEYPGSYTISYAAFKEKYEKGEIDDERTYSVYVPCHVKTFFEWIKEKTPLEIEIEGVKNTITQYRARVSNCERAMIRNSAEMKHLQSLIYTASQKLSDLQNQLEAIKEDK